MLFRARYNFWIFVLFEHKNQVLKIWIKVSQNFKKAKKRCLNPFSLPPPMVMAVPRCFDSCFLLSGSWFFFYWFTMRSTYKDGRSFIFRGWSAARLAGEHPPKSAPVVISYLSDFCFWLKYRFLSVLFYVHTGTVFRGVWTYRERFLHPAETVK